MKCDECKIEKSKSAITYLLNDMAVYEPYCYACAKEKLIKEFKIEQTDKINSKNIKGIAEALEIGKMNQMFQSPDKMKEIIDSKPYNDFIQKIIGKSQKTTPSKKVGLNSD